MLILRPTKEQKSNPLVREIIIDYLIEGGEPSRKQGTPTVYELDADGESDFSQSDYTKLVGFDVEMDGGYFHVKVSSSLMNNFVDVDLPDSKYLDENNVEQRRRYNEYFRFNYDLKDGNHLIQLVHFPHDPNYDPQDPKSAKGGTIELTDKNRRKFEKQLKVTAMVKSVGLALRPVAVVLPLLPKNVMGGV